MRAIDTNVLVRLITRDDPRQAEAADQFVADGAWVSHLVLAETMWVLESVYEINRSGIGLAVEMLLAHKQLVMQESNIVSAALKRFRHKPAIGFSDCLVLETARKTGHLPLGTFDRNLSKHPDAQKVTDAVK